MEAQQGNCTAVVHQDVQVEAVVTVTPQVRIGRGLQVECVGPLRCRRGAPPRACPPSPCSFTVQQQLRLRIPIQFGAKTNVAHGGSVCRIPELEDCGTNADF
ncbi:hypothetical protein [Tumebacillus sp. BK434]|uniref:hypothetical protein n=1 Tax=Tumebacillus sp. BK434 TaxID=2512169 RepID=UPI00104A15C7|nr:hypothetical protein [Tumebacillus sp. BK434]